MNTKLPGAKAFSIELERKLQEALEQKGQGYVPRTSHLTDEGAPRFTNRLILESSPYLLQHAHNPVSWFPWGDEAFELAAEERKLVFLSVGYSTCHWCHVMERESFEDLEIAKLLNARFIAIKVDREERPDVDNVYMKAVQALTGHGGWPMSVFLLPDSREPVFGGTYFPARDGDRGASVGFSTLLRALDERWESSPRELGAAGRALAQHLREGLRHKTAGGVPTADAIRRAAKLWERETDSQWGGFGMAPKFPQSAALELLARAYRRTGDEKLLHAVTLSLERMADGGIHDQIGGGFHRYAVDRQWSVPHFEKMLYDNAQLAVAYLQGYQLTGRERFASVARTTLDYMLREMANGEGALFSASDADSPDDEGELQEGRFFTWTPAELDAALGPELALTAAAVFGVRGAGDLEGRSVLRRWRPLEEVAQGVGLRVSALEHRIAEIRELLYQHRSSRPAPLVDTKVITAWNALAISALARGGDVLAEERFVEAAIRAARFVLARLRHVDGRLLRRELGEAPVPAFLDDYAFFTQSLLDLFETSGEGHWLELAKALQSELDERFWDHEEGGYFFREREKRWWVVRDKPAYDGAEPAGNSVAALNLLRLEQLTDDSFYRRRAEALFAAFAAELKAGLALPKMLSALDFYHDRPLQIALVLPRQRFADAKLRDVLRRAFLPNRALVAVAEGDDLVATASLVPFVRGKESLGGRATAFVCRERVCEQPTTDPAELEAQLGVAEPLPSRD